MKWYPVNKYNDYNFYLGGEGFPTEDLALASGRELERSDENIGAVQISDSVAPILVGRFINPRDSAPDDDFRKASTGEISCAGESFTCPDLAQWTVSAPGHGRRFGYASCDTHLAFMSKVAMEQSQAVTLDIQRVNREMQD